MGHELPLLMIFGMGLKERRFLTFVRNDRKLLSVCYFEHTKKSFSFKTNNFFMIFLSIHKTGLP